MCEEIDLEVQKRVHDATIKKKLKSIAKMATNAKNA